MDCQDNFGQVTLHSTGTKDDVNVLCYFLSKVKIDDVKEEWDKDVEGRDFYCEDCWGQFEKDEEIEMIAGTLDTNSNKSKSTKWIKP